MPYGLENIFANVAPNISDQALNTGIDQALAGNALSQIGSATNALAPIGQALPQGIAQISNPAIQNALPVNAFAGFGEGAVGSIPQLGEGFSLADIGNTLTGDQAQNLYKLGGQGYNLYKQGQALDSARQDQAQARKQSADVFARNKEADERRRKLNF